MVNRPSLEIVHQVPGRIRARCAALKVDPELAPEIERAAGALPGVHAVSVRPAAASVVITYSPEVAARARFDAALRRAMDISAAAVPPIPPLPARAAPGNALLAVKRRWLQTDERLRRFTRGAVDLQSLVPWILLAYSVRQLAAGRASPLPWYNALYYALQALIRYPGAPSDRAPILADPAGQS